jgi:hypothetical protein
MRCDIPATRAGRPDPRVAALVKARAFFSQAHALRWPALSRDAAARHPALQRARPHRTGLGVRLGEVERAVPRASSDCAQALHFPPKRVRSGAFHQRGFVSRLWSHIAAR